jgi:hypothetical protein
MPNDRSRFLASLTEEQLRALHAELEGLDRAQDGLVEDTTHRIRDLLEMVWKQEAAQRHDPEGYLVAAKAHYERWNYHLRRLQAGQPSPSSVKDLLLACGPGPNWDEATRLATADGFPDPSAVGDKPKVEDEVGTFLKDRGGRPLLSE